MKKLILLIAVLLISSAPLIAQAVPDFSTVKTAKGMMVINYNPRQPFSFLVAGTNPTGERNSDGGLLIQTDRQGLIVYFIRTGEFLGTRKLTDEGEILQAHSAWELAAQETSLKTKPAVDLQQMSLLSVSNLQNEMFPKKLISTAYWSYPVPNAGQPARAFYQTVLMGDQILMIVRIFPLPISAEEVRASTQAVLETLTLLPPQRKAAPPGRKVVPSRSRARSGSRSPGAR